jgi:hypothetical protein
LRRAATVLTAVLIAACSGVNVRTEVYQTLADARAAGAVEAGWVPRGIPESASDLRVGYLADGRVWGTFAFDPAQVAALRAGLLEGTAAPPLGSDPPGRIEWWPRVLRSPRDADRIRATGLRLHHDRDGRFGYAVNWSQGRAFYWRILPGA